MKQLWIWDLKILFYCKQEAFSHKIAARPERRRQFEKELISSVETALNLLAACVRFEELKEQVIFTLQFLNDIYGRGLVIGFCCF